MIVDQYTAQVRDFIFSHLEDDVSELALKTHGKTELPMGFILSQIEARQKLKAKLPEWFANPDLVIPDVKVAEQCSSAKTAAYKASLFSGGTFVDLTGGLGVDTYAFAQEFESGIYVDSDPVKVECARHNFSKLGINNVQFIESTAENFMESNSQTFDLLYVDPSRRVDEGKVITLEQSEPNMVEVAPVWRKSANTIMIKASPMMDIHLAENSLKNVSEVHVIAVDNDCKEVLYILSNNAATTYYASNITKHGTARFLVSDSEVNGLELYSEPLKYIFEPNAAIMKLKAFDSLVSTFKIKKLHPNSHLFTSEENISAFPGRTFRLLDSCPYKRKDLLKLLPEAKANVSVRNFPDSVDQIRKKLKVKTGGDAYIFATTILGDKKVLLICEKA